MDMVMVMLMCCGDRNALVPGRLLLFGHLVIYQVDVPLRFQMQHLLQRLSLFSFVKSLGNLEHNTATTSTEEHG